jgi:hypothetical protein
VTRFVTANDRTLWAAIDPDSHHLDGRVCERRFGAYLAPFRTEEDAAEALLSVGAVLDVISAPPKPGRLS